MADQLIEELAELGRAIDVAPPEDLPDRVLAALDAPVRNWWLRAAAVVVGLVAAVGLAATVSPQVRAAIEDVFGLGGVEVSYQPGPPPASGLGPGEHKTTLAQAAREVGFDVRTSPERPIDRVTVTDGRVVSIFSGDLRLDQFVGTTGQVYAKYVAAEDVDKVKVGEHRALWFREPNTLVYVDRHGKVRSESARMAARTLVWTSGDRTYRLEGATSVAQAIELAKTVG